MCTIYKQSVCILLVYLQMLPLRDRQGLEEQKSHYFQEDVCETQDLFGWNSGMGSEDMET